MRSNLLADLLATLFERRGSKPVLDAGTKTADGRSIEALCLELLSEAGEVSGAKLARAVLAAYRASDEAVKTGFFHFLADQLDLDAARAAQCALEYGKDPTRDHMQALQAATEPVRQELLRRLNQVPGATAELVKMRLDLLQRVGDHPAFARVDLDFVHLLGSWFNPGFLVLRRIGWETPANILEKIIAYEAVHAIDDWDDLRRRLQPEDRRCFAFFHPAMPSEPLIFVQVALSNAIPDSIQDVLAQARETIDVDTADTAVFYSISNCQAGLRGISFGNFLIKQVVEDLSWELPGLRTFVTLSPAPGLNRWLEQQRDAEGNTLAGEILQAAQTEPPAAKAALREHTRNLEALTATYLVQAKRSNGLPLDAVARFHLGNGAMLHDVHALADLSRNGLSQSSGAMVNYLYDVERVERHHEEFVTEGRVATSQTIQDILDRYVSNR